MLISIPIAAIHTFSTAYSQSDFFGKLIFLGLYTLSILCWVILIHKIWMTRKIKKVSSSFKTAFEKNKKALLTIDIDKLPKESFREVPHPFADIFMAVKQKTLEVLDKNLFFAKQNASSKDDAAQVYLSSNDLELVESYVLTTISSQTKNLERNLFILSTIVTLAPFLGLLGTVWGILISFSGLHGGATAGSNAAVLGGLSTALATTVLGLLIAIPALIAYNYLKNTVRTLSSDMEDFLYSLLSTLELQYRKADVS